jgi:ribosomal protein S18 acetylase RimI-like enzyme
MEIAAVTNTKTIRAGLRDLLVDVVDHGGSVHFMAPLQPQDAEIFWDGALASMARGERLMFAAFDGEVLAGTVTVILKSPPNAPHRAEIAKMMTRVSHRGRGVATALLHAAEALAVARGRTLLTLDTATEEGASVLYERLGFTFAGEIPDYALKPHGGLTGTRLYWKRIGSAAVVDADRVPRSSASLLQDRGG